MRINKLKVLLIPFICLSMISSCQVEEEGYIDYQIKSQYQHFLAESKDSLYNEAVKSVVSIMSFEEGNASSIGSGFIYDQDENYQYIITNHHVIDSGDGTKVISYTGQVANAVVLGSDSIFDVALIRSPILDDTTVAKFTNDDLRLIENPSIGEEVFAIGNPGSLGNRGTITKGIISGVDRNPLVDSSSFETADYSLQVDVTMNQGNSGGPLFNMQGEVIGINTYRIDYVDGVSYKGINFSLPIQDALLIVNEIKENGKFIRTTLGTNQYEEVRNLTLYEKGYLNIDSHSTTGIIIKDFGNLNVLNIPKYSIIYEFNGYKVDTLAEFRRRIYQLGSNKEAKIKYYEYSEEGYSIEKEITVTTRSLNY